MQATNERTHSIESIIMTASHDVECVVETPDSTPSHSLVTGGRNSSRRLNGSIVQKIGRNIISGIYAPGSTLDNQADFSAQLDVSRSSFREAMIVLAAKGLIEIRPRSGTRVLPRSHWKILDPDMIRWAFSGTPCPEYIQSISELRFLIEPGAARLAAWRRGPGDLEKLADALARLRTNSVGSYGECRAHRDFHAAVLGATQNDMMLSMAQSIGEIVYWTTFNLEKSEQMRSMIWSYTREIYKAIVAGNGENSELNMIELGKSIAAFSQDHS